MTGIRAFTVNVCLGHPPPPRLPSLKRKNVQTQTLTLTLTLTPNGKSSESVVRYNCLRMRHSLRHSSLYRFGRFALRIDIISKVGVKTLGPRTFRIQHISAPSDWCRIVRTVRHQWSELSRPPPNVFLLQ